MTKPRKHADDVLPSSPSGKGGNWVGSMRGEIQFLGDILAPVFDENDCKFMSEAAPDESDPGPAEINKNEIG